MAQALNMRNSNIWLILGIALLLLIAVFEIGTWFGEMRAEQTFLRNDFNDHRDDTRARLSSLEADRAIRERRWGWATKALAFGRKLPVVRWITN